MDDALRLRFEPTLRNPGKDERKPYRGNKNPSRREIAAEGYETMAMADPAATYGNTIENRDVLAEDSEYDPHMVRRSY